MRKMRVPTSHLTIITGTLKQTGDREVATMMLPRIPPKRSLRRTYKV
jgi:hypothetical protein